MKWQVPAPVAELLDAAAQSPLLVQRSHSPVLQRQEIEQALPHRDPFLFLDEVVHLDPEEGWIAARYDLKRGEAIVAGHFPGHPTWPGTLQVEAIAQAGAILYNRKHQTGGEIGLLTNILAARFIRKITPGADLYITARVLDYGQMGEVVGQVLQNGEICSVAAVRFYSLSEEI